MTVPEAPAGPVDVLVTGASGFLGSALVERLLSLGMTVQGTDLVAGRRPTLHMDVTDGAEVLDVFERVRPRAVVHAAAVVDDRAGPARCQQVNVGGTENVADAAASVGVARLVHVSSIGALGLDPGQDADEGSPLVFDTGSPYFDTKAAAEALVRDLHARGAMACVVVRAGDLFGPGCEPWVERPLALMRRRVPVLLGGGEGLIAHAWIDNAVDGLVLALTHEDAAGGVFQITDGVADTTFKAYVTRLAAAAGLSAPRLSLPAAMALGFGSVLGRYQRLTGRSVPLTRAGVAYICRRATYSIATSRRVLGYAPRVGLDEAFDRLARALR